MCVVQRLATSEFVAFLSLPLLTELGRCSENRPLYKYGAPNGAMPKPAPHIPPKTAKNPPALI